MTTQSYTSSLDLRVPLDNFNSLYENKQKLTSMWRPSTYLSQSNKSTRFDAESNSKAGLMGSSLKQKIRNYKSKKGTRIDSKAHSKQSNLNRHFFQKMNSLPLNNYSQKSFSYKNKLKNDTIYMAMKPEYGARNLNFMSQTRRAKPVAMRNVTAVRRMNLLPKKSLKSSTTEEYNYKTQSHRNFIKRNDGAPRNVPVTKKTRISLSDYKIRGISSFRQSPKNNKSSNLQVISIVKNARTSESSKAIDNTISSFGKVTATSLHSISDLKSAKFKKTSKPKVENMFNNLKLSLPKIINTLGAEPENKKATPTVIKRTEPMKKQLYSLQTITMGNVTKRKIVNSNINAQSNPRVHRMNLNNLLTQKKNSQNYAKKKRIHLERKPVSQVDMREAATNFFEIPSKNIKKSLNVTEQNFKTQNSNPGRRAPGLFGKKFTLDGYKPTKSKAKAKSIVVKAGGYLSNVSDIHRLGESKKTLNDINSYKNDFTPPNYLSLQSYKAESNQEMSTTTDEVVDKNKITSKQMNDKIQRLANDFKLPFENKVSNFTEKHNETYSVFSKKKTLNIDILGKEFEKSPFESANVSFNSVEKVHHSMKNSLLCSKKKFWNDHKEPKKNFRKVKKKSIIINGNIESKPKKTDSMNQKILKNKYFSEPKITKINGSKKVSEAEVKITKKQSEKAERIPKFNEYNMKAESSANATLINKNKATLANGVDNANNLVKAPIQNRSKKTQLHKTKSLENIINIDKVLKPVPGKKNVVIGQKSCLSLKEQTEAKSENGKPNEIAGKRENGDSKKRINRFEDLPPISHFIKKKPNKSILRKYKSAR